MKHGYSVLLVAGALALAGCGTTAHGSAAPPRASQETYGPLTPLDHSSHIAVWSHDLIALAHDTGECAGALNTWADDQSLPPPVSAATQAQYAQASAEIGAGTTILPVDARAILADIAALPSTERPSFAALQLAAQTILATVPTVIRDTTTPWAGPGSSPAVTKTVILQRVRHDAAVLTHANIVVAKEAAEASLAYAYYRQH